MVLIDTFSSVLTNSLLSLPSKKQRKLPSADLMQTYGVSGIRRKSLATHNSIIFIPDLPPIDEEESDSSMETEDEDVEENCGVGSSKNNIDRDIEVISNHFI